MGTEKLGLLVLAVFRFASAPAFADCQWKVVGKLQDQTGVFVPNMRIQIYSQPATGSAFEPQTTGPKETAVWPAAKTDAGGSFSVVSTPFVGAACLKSRMVGAVAGSSTPAGDVGPMEGPKSPGELFTVDIGVIGVGVSRDEIR